MNQLRQTIERAAKANSRILIVGPSGSGKELVARTLHQASGRAEGPFVVINAAAITPERMEEELFGVEQPNGEQQRKVGALEEAHGGTLFVDEIGDMPRETQNKILRVLVDQTFQRVGGTNEGACRRPHHLLDRAQPRGGNRRRPFPRRPLPSPVGGADPRAAARRNGARTSLELIDYFMDQISATTGLPKRQIGQDAMAVLQSHVWPGNVRQLRNNVERVMILASGGPEVIITADMLPQDVGSMVPAMPTCNNGEHIMGLPLREAREVVRARLSDRSDQPFFRQHLANRGICRHGALGPASQAEGARRGLNRVLFHAFAWGFHRFRPLLPPKSRPALATGRKRLA